MKLYYHRESDTYCHDGLKLLTGDFVRKLLRLRKERVMVDRWSWVTNWNRHKLCRIGAIC